MVREVTRTERAPQEKNKNSSLTGHTDGVAPPPERRAFFGACPLIPKGRDAFRLAVQQTAATLYPRMGANPGTLDSLFKT